MSTVDTFDPIPVAEFIDRILELYRPPLRAKATYTRMRQVLGIVGAMGVETTADLNTSFVARFVAARAAKGEHPNTTASLLSSLRAACGLASDEGWIRRSPFARRRRWVQAVTPRPPVYHGRQEIARALDLARCEIGEASGWEQWKARRLYALLATVAFSGMRKNEALHLRTEDVDQDRRLLMIVARKGHRLKTAASGQPVPLAVPLAAILADWIQFINPGWLFPTMTRADRPWTGGVQGTKPLDQLQALGRRAGVEGLGFLSLRHSWATLAQHWGFSSLEIARVLRHTSTRTQAHYLHPDADGLRRMADRIDFGPPGAGPQ